MTNNKKTGAILAVLAAVTFAAVAPALAQDYRDRGDYRNQERSRYNENRYYGPTYYGQYYGPGYVYAAPPPVVYAPPQSAGIDFIFPIHIR
ncbi:MAG TPA: hypothetical protein VFC38_05600 [Stellaceae bacterium]|nr:hypothetical protein [Stellaceae bacterium]